MRLAKIGVTKPVTVIIVFLAVTLLGGVSLSMLNQDLFPDISFPMVTVITPYPGAGPEEVEQNVTKTLENELAVVGGLDKITSTSEENISMITLAFDWDISVETATNDVRDKLDLASRKLPDGTTKPFVFKMDMGMMPIAIFSIETTPERFPTFRRYAEEIITDPLKKVPGVAQVMLMGGVERTIRIKLDRAKLEAMKVPYTTLAQSLVASNLTIPGGKTKIGKTSFLLRVPGEFQSVKQIREVVIGMNPQTGSILHLGDVAEVTDAVNEQELFSENSKGPALMMMVNKQSNANTVEVANKVFAKLEEIKKKLPKDVSITVVRDMSQNIKRTVSNLINVVVTGAIFVVLVILIFLRDLRGGFIMGITIPISLIITFLFMFIKGYTLNMITLTSLSVAIGMVVDNGIVILENIVHHIERGARPSEAAVEGSAEVSGSIIASTLTTIVIFLPVVYVSGMVGIMFSQLAFVITMTLVASLVVAVLLVPTLSSLMLKKHEPKGLIGKLYKGTEWLFVQLEQGYSRLLAVCLNNKLISFSVISGVALFSLVLIPYVGTEFIPAMDSGFIQAQVELPPGTHHSESAKYARELLYRMKDRVPERQAMIASWGKSEDSAMAGSATGGESGENYVKVFLALKPKKVRNRSDRQIADSLQDLTTIFPGAKVSITPFNSSGALMGGSGGKPIEIEIFGHNPKIAANLAGTIKGNLERIAGVRDVEMSSKGGVPEYSIILDREKASAVGVNMYLVGTTVRTAYNGANISKFRQEGDEFDIFLQLRQEDRKSLKSLKNLQIPTVAGGFVELGNIARITQRQGPARIERKNEVRVVKVSANIQGRDLGSVSEDVEKMLGTIKAPAGFSIEFGGDRKEQQKGFRSLILALIIGILLVYFVMAAQFENLLDPFIILFTIPFAMMGALWAFVMTGQTLSLLSFIGLIMLVGIVVNNGIVLIDYIRILRKRGMKLVEAVLAGGRSRLRPVLMTTTTTIIGMIPLAMSTGEGAEVWVAMSTAVIGGLTVSTLMTLLFVPILYTFFEGGRERRAMKRPKKAREKRLKELDLIKEM